MHHDTRGSQAEVLVIGAGPSGLFVAVELARHGVPARVIEREPEPHLQARATAVKPATLEMLADAGVLDRFLAASVHVRFARVFDADLQMVGESAFAGIGCAWEFECSLPQWSTEAILSERLQELGGTVERGVAASSLEARDDGVRARLERADGSAETVEAGWVIGAGGAHSLTRASMAESWSGDTYPGSALVANVRVRCALPRDGSALIATPAGYVLLAPLPDERWITFVGDLSQSEADRLAGDASNEAVAATVERRLASRLQVEDVAWAAPFRMHHRLVSHLTDRRRFLLGDAGHLSSPFGGEGLNSGIHDAHNLAWKLALAVRRRGRPRLLDSFEWERLAADRHVLQVSDRLHQMAYGAVESARTGVRPAPLTEEEMAALLQSRSMLDVSYAGGALFGQHVSGQGNPGPPPAPGERYPDRVKLKGTGHHLLVFGSAAESELARLGRRWDGLVEIVRATGDPAPAGLPGPGAVLVRPDGFIAFRSAPADAAGLTALDAHLDSYLIPA